MIRPVAAGVKKYTTPKPHIENYHKIFYGKKHLPQHVLNTTDRVAFRVMRNDDVAMGVANALMLSEGVNHVSSLNSAAPIIGSKRTSQLKRGLKSEEVFASDKLSPAHARKRTDKRSHYRRGEDDTRSNEASHRSSIATFQRPRRFKRIQQQHDPVRKFLDMMGRQWRGEHAMRIANLLERAGHIPNTSNFNTLMTIAMLRNDRNKVGQQRERDRDGRSPGLASGVNPLTGPPPASELLGARDSETVRRVSTLALEMRSEPQPSKQSNYDPVTDLKGAVTKLWDMSIGATVTNSSSPSSQRAQNSADAVANNIYIAASSGYGWALTLQLYQKMISHRKYPDNYTLSMVMGAYKRGGLWAHCIHLFIGMIREGSAATTASFPPFSSEKMAESNASSSANILEKAANTNVIIPPICFSLALAAARQCPDYTIALHVFNIGIQAASVGLVEMNEAIFIHLLRAVADAQIMSAYEIEARMRKEHKEKFAFSKARKEEKQLAAETNHNHGVGLEADIATAVRDSNDRWASYALQVLESIPTPLLRITTINTVLKILRVANRSEEATALVGKIGASRVVKIHNLDAFMRGGAKANTNDQDNQVFPSSSEGGGAEGSDDNINASVTGLIDNLLSASLSDAAMAEELSKSRTHPQPQRRRQGIADVLSRDGKDTDSSSDFPREADIDSNIDVDGISMSGKTRPRQVAGREKKENAFIKKDEHEKYKEQDEEEMEDFFYTPSPTVPSKSASTPSPLNTTSRASSSGSSRSESVGTAGGNLLSEKRFEFDLALARMTPSAETMSEFHAVMTRVSKEAEEALATGPSQRRGAFSSPLSKTNPNTSSSYHQSYLLVSPPSSSSVGSLGSDTHAPLGNRTTLSSPDDALFTVFNWCRSLAMPIPTAVLTQLILSLYRKGLNKTAEALVSTIVRDACLDPGNPAICLSSLYKSLAIAILHHPSPTIAAALLRQHHHRISALINPLTEGFGVMGTDADKTMWIFETARSTKNAPDDMPKIAVVDAAVVLSTGFGSLVTHYDKIVVSFNELVHLASLPEMANKESPANKGMLQSETSFRHRLQRYLNGHFTTAQKIDLHLDDKAEGPYSGIQSEKVTTKVADPDWDFIIDGDENSDGSHGALSSSSSTNARVSKLMFLPYSHQLYANKFLHEHPGNYESQRSHLATSEAQIEPQSSQVQGELRGRDVQLIGGDEELLPTRIEIRSNARKHNYSLDDTSTDKRTSERDAHTPTIDNSHLPPPPPLGSFLGHKRVASSLATALMLATLNRSFISAEAGENTTITSSVLGKTSPNDRLSLDVNTARRSLHQEYREEQRILRKESWEVKQTLRVIQAKLDAINKTESDTNGSHSSTRAARTNPEQRSYLGKRATELNSQLSHLTSKLRKLPLRYSAPNSFAAVDLYVSNDEDRLDAYSWLTSVTTDNTLVHVRVFRGNHYFISEDAEEY